MPQDMSQFLQVFFEETEEHLATLELLLIGLDLDRPDSETLHGIFRAAHSIKGSSGMFGFDDITAVTHELETLLDRIRCGSCAFRGLEPCRTGFSEQRWRSATTPEADCSVRKFQ
ncbi:Hpt domain-containing protein, partial [Pseudomonas aeruginosa]|nr:Hpt domain-containing protein [Pseudomonas aeruginosa]